MKAFLRCFALLSAVLCLATQAVLAHGIIVIHPPIHPPHHPPHHPHPPDHPPIVPPGHFTFAPHAVKEVSVRTEIRDLRVSTTVEQLFHNPNPSRLEGTWIFPLPQGARIDSFQMDIDGKMTEAELLSAEKARGIYEQIVREKNDPA